MVEISCPSSLAGFFVSINFSNILVDENWLNLGNFFAGFDVFHGFRLFLLILRFSLYDFSVNS